jgi:hypothetical protein
MKDKLLIFICSLVLTLAATGSALAATESATGLVLAATGFDPMSRDDDDDKDPKCPAQNERRCDRVGGDFSKDRNKKTCKVDEKKKCYGGEGYSHTRTVWTKSKGNKCVKKVYYVKKCPRPPPKY